MATAIALRRRLINELREIAEADGEGDLSRCTRQLAAMIYNLQHNAEVLVTNPPHQPLLKLYWALQSLCFGGKPPLLFEAPRPDDVKTKPKLDPAHFAQGLLVVGYAALIERARQKPADAREWLDKELRARHMLGQVSGGNCQQWYNQSQAPQGRLAPMVMEAIKSFRPGLSDLHSEADAKRFARSCLDAVCGLGLQRIRLRKPKLQGS